jgi:hypothetical protein
VRRDHPVREPRREVALVQARFYSHYNPLAPIDSFT